MEKIERMDWRSSRTVQRGRKEGLDKTAISKSLLVEQSLRDHQRRSSSCQRKYTCNIVPALFFFVHAPSIRRGRR